MSNINITGILKIMILTIETQKTSIGSADIDFTYRQDGNANGCSGSNYVFISLSVFWQHL
jgi:hypothetical protein